MFFVPPCPVFPVHPHVPLVLCPPQLSLCPHYIPLSSCRALHVPPSPWGLSNPPCASPLSPGLSTASSLSSPSGLSDGPGSVPLPPGPPGPSEDDSWGVAVPPSPPEDALAPPSDTLQVKAGASRGWGHP